MNPLELYAVALQGAPARVRYRDGRCRPLDAPTWVSRAAPGDEALLARCGSATLDVGCGPGRLVRALSRAGVSCTGVDLAPAAVALARSGGADVLHADVHDPVLDGTRWSTVLLADGNIGIGGDPVSLLRRAAGLLTPDGEVVVELDPPSTPSGRVQVRLESGPLVSSWFPWAHVAADDVAAVALPAGLQLRDSWSSAGRHFAALGRACVAQAAA